MRALITDLTRMYDYHVCAAGIDMDTGKRVRPVLGMRLGSRMLSDRGGALDIGNVVDFGRCRPCGKPPEIEDTAFDQRGVRLQRSMTCEEFMAAIRAAAVDSLDVFGPALVRHGNSLATEAGSGSRSLAVLRATEPPLVTCTNDRVRLRWRDGVWLSVTDVRLYERDLTTPSETKLASLRHALGSAGEVYLSFGLGRPWQQPGDDRARHYLQLNNVHVPEWPDWRLGAIR